MAGFDDPNYFARVFKKAVGVTPQQWRAAPRPIVGASAADGKG